MRQNTYVQQKRFQKRVGLVCTTQCQKIHGAGMIQARLIMAAIFQEVQYSILFLPSQQKFVDLKGMFPWFDSQPDAANGQSDCVQIEQSKQWQWNDQECFQ